ncbi:helix-turn-helix domain-containing protein [Butyrivibrio sp. WCD3002]|uniref:helix-turn-helix domain-containing protein n=1 Tax=Butyrivibrio sp. WCD3002 TaxID=1280676 RepID=UPI00047BCC62
MSFSILLRRQRRKRGMTQRDLAAAMIRAEGMEPFDDLMLVDANRQRIMKCENNKSEPRLTDIILVTRALGCRFEELLDATP